jgi:hypothetical protein
MKNLFKIIVLITAVIAVSCTPSRVISYNLNKVQPSTDQVNKSLSIENFVDIRSTFPENQVYLQAKSNSGVKIDGKNSCVNAEKQYKIPVAKQLTDMFTKYLQKKAYFSSVSENQKGATDYYLTAEVKQFSGYQGFSNKAAVGAQFGLIGALATANVKTDGEMAIELINITLFNKDGKLIANLGNLKKETNGNLPVDAYCNCIYSNINLFLADVYTELGDMVYQELRKSQQ